MVKKSSLVLGMGLLIGGSIFVVGCKSPSTGISNPFASKPKPAITAPAEMDNMNLKAPPERYTKEDYLQNGESREGKLAQSGSYRADDLGEKSEAREPIQTAMNPDAAPRYSEKNPSANRQEAAERYSSDETSSSPSYQTAPTSGRYDAPGFGDDPSYPSDSEISGKSSAPFAPGSIGGY